MNLRDIFVSVGCCAAAVCLGFGKPTRAGELQSSNETASRAPERCATSGAPVEETAGCERIDGHVRVEFGSRMPNASGYGRPGASPIAVRLDEGTPSRGHLRLPAGDSGLDPFRR
ncbi:MAG: hypothetical protein ACRECZ_06335 [Methylocella sp.]